MSDSRPNLSVIQLAFVTSWIDDLITRPECSEAIQVALDLVSNELARLELRTDFAGGRAPAHRLLLVPEDGDGLSVELMCMNCDPVAPTPEGVASRIWFFGRLSHWQIKQ